MDERMMPVFLAGATFMYVAWQADNIWGYVQFVHRIRRMARKSGAAVLRCDPRIAAKIQAAAKRN